MTELNQELAKISCDLGALEDICLVMQDVIEKIPVDKKQIENVPIKYQDKWNAISMAHIVRCELKRLADIVDKFGGGKRNCRTI